MAKENGAGKAIGRPAGKNNMQYIGRFSDKLEVKERFDKEVTSVQENSFSGTYSAPEHIRSVYKIVSRLGLFSHELGGFDMGKITRIQKFLEDERSGKINP